MHLNADQLDEVTVIDKKSNSTMDQYITEHWITKGFYWAKGVEIGENVYTLAQHQVGCKDYIVDTQFRGQSCYDIRKWTKKEHRNNVVFITCPLGFASLNYYVDLLLHPIEDKMGFQRTQLVIPTILKQGNRKVNNVLEHNTIILHGDDRWNSNGFVWSLYLSIIRVMTYSKINSKYDCITTLFNNVDGCNERNYWHYAMRSKRSKQFILWATQNIDQLFPKINPIQYDIYTGYRKGKIIGHGATGAFFICNNLTTSLHYEDVYKQHGLNYPYQDTADNIFIQLYRDFQCQEDAKAATKN